MRDMPSTTGGVGIVHLLEPNIVLPFAIFMAIAAMRTKDIVNHTALFVTSILLYQ
jgi:hypothetical protein